MLFQMSTQASGVAGIDEFHRAAKCGVFNSLVVWAIQLIRERGFFNVMLEPRPAGKSILTGNGELRVAEG